MEGKRVVVIGGGIAGIHVAKELQSHAVVTLIDPKDYLEIPYAQLRSVVEPSFAERSTILYSEVLTQTKHIMSSAVAASREEVTTSDGERIPFDFLVICTGSARQAAQTRVQRRQEFHSDNERLKKINSVLIIGGGPVGVELAGEIVTDFPEKSVTIVQSSDRLIDFLGPKASTKALNWLQSKSVNVILNDRVNNLESLSPPLYTTQSGREIKADGHFVCVGSAVSNSWLRDAFVAESLDDRGRLKVDSYLRVQGTENVFAAGDITDIKEIKQGFLAERHAAVVAANIKQLMHKADTTCLKKYKPLASPMGLVSLGRNAGVMELPYVGARVGWVPGRIKSKDLFVGKVRKGLGLKD